MTWVRTREVPFTYVGTADPADAQLGETLLRTDTDEAKVYDGAGWQTYSVDDFAELGGSISAGQIPTGVIGTDAIAAGAVSQNELGFDTATQSELDNHAGDADAHHPEPTLIASGSYAASYGGDWYIGHDPRYQEVALRSTTGDERTIIHTGLSVPVVDALYSKGDFDFGWELYQI